MILLYQIEHASTNPWDLAHDYCGTWCAHIIHFVGLRCTHQVLERCLITHLEERRATFLHTDSVESSVVSIEGHEITDEGEMSPVHRDTINPEHHLNFLHDVCSHGFDTIFVLECIRVIGFDPINIDGIRVRIESVEVDALNN